MVDIPKLRLASGTDMPVLGLGTWQLTGDDCYNDVKKALELGYGHIYTAEIYGNQVEIGKAIMDLPREKLFLTSKVWRENLHYDDVLKACDKTLAQLGTDYLDQYLIHWPNKDIPMKETIAAWKGFMEKVSKSHGEGCW